MPEKYAYRVRILVFAWRKKYSCRYTHAEIRTFGKRHYVKQTSKSKNFRCISVLFIRYFFTHMRKYRRSVKAAQRCLVKGE